MSGLHFRLQTDADRLAHLRRAHVVGGDGMPWPSAVDVHDGDVCVRREISESGAIHLPWRVDDVGDVYLQTASLMERQEPYRFIVELARGQLNKFRNQLADWEHSGLATPDPVREAVRESARALLRAIRAEHDAESETQAQESLRLSLGASELLTRAYAANAILARQRKPGKSHTLIGCRFDDSLLPLKKAQRFVGSFQHVTIPLRWKRLEPRQGEFDWNRLDRRVQWCKDRGLPFAIGPLLDFRADALPDWLWLWESDPENLVTFMLDVVETCMERYKGQVTHWETTARANSAELLSLNEEQMLWLTSRVIDVARNIDPQARLVVGIDQPWGEYLGRQDRTYSPFTFVDTLLRMGLRLAALDLEIAMGYEPGGSYCRSMMDLPQLLSHYHELGLPLQLTLYYPSAPVVADDAHPVSTQGGYWHEPFNEKVQADWAQLAVLVGLAKPFVELMTWGQFRDGADNAWPEAGLVTGEGQPKRSLGRCRQLRQRFFAS